MTIQSYPMLITTHPSALYLIVVLIVAVAVALFNARRWTRRIERPQSAASEDSRQIVNTVYFG